MSDGLISFELSSDLKQLDIHFDKIGIERMIAYLERLCEKDGHDHLMTSSWGGTELSEEKQGDDSILLHRVSIHFW
jgi:Immunity protein 32